MGIRDIVFPFNSDLSQLGFTVTDTATKFPIGPAAVGRRGLLVFNNSTKLMFFGDSTVTTSTGMVLVNDTGFIIAASEDVNIFFIVASGTADLRVTEVIE
ncbi:MAG: hypothetical protein IIC74_10145 [Bacteroidetes bacterium]|nr:hypothetical protein [Bacteroidota bacterium]